LIPAPPPMPPGYYTASLIVVAALTAAYAVWALGKAGVIARLRPPAVLRRRPPIPVAVPPPEQRLAEAEARLRRAEAEVKRLRMALSKAKYREVERRVRAEAEDLQPILHEKMAAVDPERSIIGRPIYYTGGVPVVDYETVSERLAERYRWLTLILGRNLACRLLRWFFTKGHTLYWWGVTLLPDGKWGILATSKPPKLRRGLYKIPPLTLRFILRNPAAESLDELILNKASVAFLKAAVVLQATVLGPYPVEEFAEFERALRWRWPPTQPPKQASGKGGVKGGK